MIRSLLVGVVVAIFLLIIWQFNLFSHIRLQIENVYFVPADVSGEVVIVGIDDASLQTYGRSPVEWPRTVYSDLIERLSSAQARVIAFDLLFSESEPEDITLAAAIRNARQSGNRVRTIMASAGVLNVNTENLAPGADTYRTLNYNNALLPNNILFNAIDRVGYTNTVADIDNYIRRQPSLIRIQNRTDEHVSLSFSLSTYLAYLRIPETAIFELLKTEPHDLQITPNRSLPIDQNGVWRQNFYGLPSTPEQHTFPVYSLVEILNGIIEANVFNDKIVLVGLINSTRAIDHYPVPISNSGRFMSGVEIQANAIETLIQNDLLREQSKLSQALLIIAISLIASLIYMHSRWLLKLLFGVIFLVMWILAALVIFNTQHLIVNLFHPGLAIVLPAMMSIVININMEIGRRRQSERMLESVVQISEQRLQMDSIIQHIAADVRQLYPQSSGAIWLPDGHSGKLTTACRWPEQNAAPLDSLHDLAQRAAQNKQTCVDKAQIAVPLVWQQELLGVCSIALQHNNSHEGKALPILENLSVQVAPGLKNALLYQEVDRQRATLEAILVGSPAGILVLDANLNIVRCNEVLGKTLGVDFVTYIGQAFLDLLDGIDVDSTICNDLKQNLDSGETFRQHVPINTKHFNLDAAPLHEYRQWVIVLSDITQLSELNNLRTRMIRLASHDLKNPLAVALGYTDFLMNFGNDQLSKSSKAMMNNIINALKDMNQIITDILDIEQLRSGVTHNEKLDFSELASGIIAKHASEATHKQLHYESYVEESSLFVSGDYTQLGQALSNLIGNAIKYTPKSGTINIRVLADVHKARFEVQDTGYGIPQSAQAKLFTEFYRVRTEATSGIPGTGLGLSLVKSIVDSHNGHVWVESEEGQGSTFFIELPLI